jgi:hypothetical protein
MNIKFEQVGTASENIYQGHLFTPDKDLILVECDKDFEWAYFIDKDNTSDETWFRTGEGYQHKAGNLMGRHGVSFCAQVESAILNVASQLA